MHFRPSAPPQVVWQWYNFVADNVPVGKYILRINMDESSVPFTFPAQKGNIVAKLRSSPSSTQLVQEITRKEIRTMFTLVAFICDDPSLQPRMPQIVLAPRGFVLSRDAPPIAQSLPTNIYVVRRKSAWMDLAMMLQIIRLLGAILEPLSQNVTPILIMDACKVHFAEAVVRACRRANIVLIIVPARMTWLQQPCDTHAFHSFKMVLRSLLLAARAKTMSGRLDTYSFFQCLYKAIRSVLQGVRWARSFDQDGFSLYQENISRHVRRVLQLPCNYSAPSSALTESVLSLAFPRGSRIPFEELFAWHHAPSLPRIPTGILTPPAPPTTELDDSAFLRRIAARGIRADLA